MKQKIIIILCALVLIGVSNTGGSIGTPNVTTLTWLNIPFEAVDTTTGVGRIPDSVSVVVWFGNCTNAGIFQVSSASLDSNWWDSTQTGAGVGSKIYFFKEVIADIDADSGAGLYSGVINAWFQGYPMPTSFSFNLLDNDLNRTLESLRPDSAKHLYVTPGGNGSNDGSTWTTSVCSLRIAETLCTGASSYVIHVASGSYAAQCCTVDVNNVEIRGNGIGRSVLNGVADNRILSISANGCRVTGFTMIGSGSGDENKPIYVSGDDCYFADIRIEAGKFAFYVAAPAQDYLIERVQVFNYSLDGFYVDGDNGILRDCVIDSATNTGADGLIFQINSQNNVAYNCVGITSLGSVFKDGAMATGTNAFFNCYGYTTDGERSTFESPGVCTYYVGNHGISGRAGVDETSTIEEDIYYSPRSANFDSGYTATRAANLDEMPSDIIKVDGDTSAAKNFKRAFDNDSTTWAWKLQLRQFQVIADAGNNDAGYFSGFGTGSGIYGTSAGNGFGANLKGNTNAGLEIGCLSGPCVGVNIFADGDASGVCIQSGDGEHPTAAVFLDGLGDANGLSIQATDDAIRIQGGMRGVIIDGKPAFVCSSSTDNAVEIYGNQDVVLAGDGLIHGTLSSITADDGFGVVDTICTTSMVRDSTNFAEEAQTGNKKWKGMFLQFTTGQNAGVTRLIEDFRNYGEFILHPALPYAPAVDDKFRIMSLVVGERRPNIIRIVD